MITRSNPFGLLAFLNWNHPWNRHHFDDDTLDAAISQLKDLGIPMIRMDFLWDDVHDGFHRYNFRRYETLVQKLMDHNIEILGILNYNKTREIGGKIVWNQPPDSFEEFASYVGATVANFKSAIRHWEIWNEPNLPTYWAGPKDGLRLYASLLSKSYQAAKKADPSCLVMNGGLTEPLIQDVTNLYRTGSRHFFDRLNIHLFLSPQTPKAVDVLSDHLDQVRQIMTSYGDEGKGIWLTEIGCPGLPPDITPLSWFAGGPVSEIEQKEWLTAVFSVYQRIPYLEKIFWAFYRDTENEFQDGTDYLGLVRKDLSPKPAFFEFKKLIADFLRNRVTT